MVAATLDHPGQAMPQELRLKHYASAEERIHIGGVGQHQTRAVRPRLRDDPDQSVNTW
jgi:hypothetical protein